jgi:hypothetical protein
VLNVGVFELVMLFNRFHGRLRGKNDTSLKIPMNFGVGHDAAPNRGTANFGGSPFTGENSVLQEGLPHHSLFCFSRGGSSGLAARSAPAAFVGQSALPRSGVTTLL